MNKTELIKQFKELWQDKTEEGFQKLLEFIKTDEMMTLWMEHMTEFEAAIEHLQQIATDPDFTELHALYEVALVESSVVRGQPHMRVIVGSDVLVHQIVDGIVQRVGEGPNGKGK